MKSIQEKLPTGSAAIALITGLLAGSASAQPAGGEIALPSTPIVFSDVKQLGEGRAPYINSWLLLGTFDNDAANSGYDRAFINEGSIAPQESQSIDGQTWRYFDDRLFSRNYDDYNDLFSYYSIKQNGSSAAKVAYLHTYVYSPSAQNVQLRVSADTSFKAWVNGKLTVASTQSTPPTGPILNAAGQSDLNSSSDRDYVVTAVSLNSGWNRLLLKIANVEDGRFGCYARFTEINGDAPRGLIYSTGGGEGKLVIENNAMPEAKTPALPVAWREWPYVGARPDMVTFAKEAKAETGKDGQKPPIITGIFGRSYINTSKTLQSTDFKLTARGGQAPYAWTKVSGELPQGVTLAADGTMSGTPAMKAHLGDYKFSVQVRDARGQSARREYSLSLQERPNRQVEQKRLLALIHNPEKIDVNDVPKLAHLMKRQGYSYGIPITFNNGEHRFRWPSKYGPNIAPDDRPAVFKKALEGEGLGFGMYMGNLNIEGATPFPVNQQVLVLKELLERYHPKILWFDWLGVEGTSLDSLYSVIRSYDPNIVVILNGSERLANGDWDEVTFEAFGSWNKQVWNIWPGHFTWPKKHSPESWRVMVDKSWSMSGDYTSTWEDVMRIQLALIGEGFIADMDHSVFLGKPEADEFFNYPLMKNHAAMANWANPVGAPPLYEAYTNVETGPLKAASWGYNMMNLKGDAVYLIATKNPHGKNGLPSGGKLNLGPIASKVKSVTLMNTSTPLKFTQATGTRSVTIDIQNVKQDEIATIIKIALVTSLPEGSSLPVARPVPSNAPTPPGNLATGKPSWLMSADNSHELVPSVANMAVYGVDGDANSSAQAGGEWAWSYKVDLQKTAKVRRIVANFTDRCWATLFRVHLSLDGVTWKTVTKDLEGKPGPNEINIEPTAARFVRIEAIKPDDAGQVGLQMAIGELEVYE